MNFRKKALAWDYSAVVKRVKSFELRPDDGIQQGDTITLCEWRDGCYTGREVTREVRFVLRNSKGLDQGFCIIGF